MAARNKPPYRADHVGSLLRPDALLISRNKWHDGEISLDLLREHEDACIKEAVKMQEDVGFDGRHRRRVPACQLPRRFHPEGHQHRRAVGFRAGGVGLR